MKSISFKDKFEKQVAKTIQSNDEVRDAINDAVKDRFVDNETFDQRFDRILEEMRLEREKSSRKWDESQKRWEENNRKWAEGLKKSEESDRKWHENQKKLEENDRKWEENQKNINELIASIKLVEIDHKKLMNKFTEGVCAIGSRWGSRSEQSFRNALKGILEEATQYKVVNVIENDEDGVVFGWPAQVELDIVVTNGKFFIIEIKSSVSAGEVAIFVKKAKFYQEKHNKKANALVIISPMIDEKAGAFIRDQGIIAYSYASDVEPGIVD